VLDREFSGGTRTAIRRKNMVQVRNEPDVAPMTPDEVQSAELNLRGRLRGRVYSLCLTVSEEGFVLHGHSRTYYAKQLAQHMLMAMSRLPIAANEIIVS
jgi:hypothetical protein